MKTTLTIIAVLLNMQISGQDITADTINANNYYTLAEKFRIANQLDSALLYVEKAQRIYIKHFDENDIRNANCLNLAGKIYYSSSKLNEALTCYQEALVIRKSLFTEKHSAVGFSYISIGNVYNSMDEYDKAIEYYLKGLDVFNKLYGDNNSNAAAGNINIGNAYQRKSEYDKALEFHLKGLRILKENLGEINNSVAIAYDNIGIDYYCKAEYDIALEYYLKGLEITKKLYDEKNILVAYLLNHVGNVYKMKSQYYKANEYYLQGLEVFKKILGEKHTKVANFLADIGDFYETMTEYDKALEYYIKGMEILKELFGEEHSFIADSYMSIGYIYYKKTEYSKALEYDFKSLELFKKLYGEKHVSVAAIYGNIGIVYRYMKDFDKALEYYLKGLDINKKLLGENHTSIASTYINIGEVYYDKALFNKALEYYQNGLEILIKLLGEKNTYVALTYTCIGDVYFERTEFDKALNCYFKGLEISKELLGEKNRDVASIYNKIGKIYSEKKLYGQALKYYQTGIASSLRFYNDTINLYHVPNIKNYLEYSELLIGFKGKAESLAKDQSSLDIALRHYQTADTIIGQVRQSISQIGDKIALGATVNQIYEGSINVSKILSEKNALHDRSSYYLDQAFYFLERSKSMVLLESIASSKGMMYSNMPDSLTQKEHNLKIEISLYEKSIAEEVDITKQLQFQTKMFATNRKYEDLIRKLEKDYPNYYNLKYSEKQPNLKELKEQLNSKVAICSYFLGDSCLYIFIITKDKLKIRAVMGISGFHDSIKVYRSSLTGDPKFINRYLSSGSYLYQKLFPKNSGLTKDIENIVIIPDGSLAFIPFESLPMADYLQTQGATSQTVDSLRGFKTLATSITSGNMKDFPFLIKQFNISYAYSATLYYQSCLAEQKNSKKETPSWLAIAPVFSDKDNKKATSETLELQRRMKFYSSDTLSTRGTLLSGEYVLPLPGTESETSSILGEFKAKKFTSRVLLKDEATEKTIKSGLLENYRILHFATHGFVNSEKPKLSGVLLAQDSTGGQDGILYSGELYNLKLNADLTVLSACETGLGKVRKGEGIIGLTRALLYAGSKNIIVSLWPVSDNSTSELMIDFYKNLLNGKKKESYSQWLRKAKLKMINEGRYSNPFYWSPFILVGF